MVGSSRGTVVLLLAWWDEWKLVGAKTIDFDLLFELVFRVLCDTMFKKHWGLGVFTLVKG